MDLLGALEVRKMAAIFQQNEVGSRYCVKNRVYAFYGNEIRIAMHDQCGHIELAELRDQLVFA
jgi:hypothetical protein